MRSNLIKTIYLYVFSGLGLGLFLFGVFSGVFFLVNVTQFDKYPLQTYEETQCDYPHYGPYAKPVPIGEETREATPSSQEFEEQERKCEERLELTRQRKKVDDATRTLAFLIIGSLVFIPHWRMARKN